MSARRVVVILTKMVWRFGLGFVLASKRRARGELAFEHNLAIFLCRVPIIWNIIMPALSGGLGQREEGTV